MSALTILQSQEIFVRRIMEEICRIAEALGHQLPSNIVDINMENTCAMPPYKISMLLDYENGLPMETEAILGHAGQAWQALIWNRFMR